MVSECVTGVKVPRAHLARRLLAVLCNRYSQELLIMVLGVCSLGLHPMQTLNDGRWRWRRGYWF